MDPYLLEMELNKPEKPRIKKRRGKRYRVSADGRTEVLIEKPPKPALVPSADQGELRVQIIEARKRGELLPFLEDALQAASFRVRHVVAALEAIAAVKNYAPQVFNKFDFDDTLAIDLLANRGAQHLLQDGASLGTAQVASAWYSLAYVGEDIPKLRNVLGVELARLVLNTGHSFHWAEDVVVVKGINLLWRWLGEAEPEMQARILKPFVDQDRFRQVRQYLKNHRKEEQAYFRAFHQLNQQAPDLQLPLYPAPTRRPKEGDPLRIGARRGGRRSKFAKVMR